MDDEPIPSGRVGPKRALTRRAVLKGIGATGGGLAGLAAVNALAPALLPERMIFDANRSHWSRALPPPNPALAQHLQVDAAIVGGGFTGLSAAYYLARRLPGRRIALLEARACGNGASARNGAMVLNLKSAAAAPAIAQRLYALTLENVARLRALSEASAIDCELEQNGALSVVADAGHMRSVRAEFEILRSNGLPLQMWDGKRIAAAIGTNAYDAAVFDPGAGQVHPGKLVRLWKSLAEASGALIYEQTTVASIEEGPVHTLTTLDGYRIRAPLLVLATNAYASKLGYFRSAVAPIANYVGITAPIDEARLAALGWKALIPFDDSHREVYYAGLTRDRRIHFGGGPVDYAFNDAMAAPANAASRYADLHREFGRVFPALAALPFETTWSGFVDVSLDQNPSVGRMGRHGNILYGIGYSGEGVNLTSVFGRIIADLAAGNSEEWGWFPYLNRRLPYIPNEPFRWLTIEADLAYGRFTGA